MSSSASSIPRTTKSHQRISACGEPVGGASPSTVSSTSVRDAVCSLAGDHHGSIYPASAASSSRPPARRPPSQPVRPCSGYMMTPRLPLGRVSSTDQQLVRREQSRRLYLPPSRECHRTVGMVFSRQQRDPLLPGLNSGDSGCFSDTVSQGAAEVCEEFYDTLYRRVL